MVTRRSALLFVLLCLTPTSTLGWSTATSSSSKTTFSPTRTVDRNSRLHASSLSSTVKRSQETTFSTSSEDLTAKRSNKQQRRGWLRRVFRKKDDSSKRLSMKRSVGGLTVLEDETLETMMSGASATDFIRRSFELESPANLFSFEDESSVFSFTPSELAVIEEVKKLAEIEAVEETQESLEGSKSNAVEQKKTRTIDGDAYWDGGSPVTRLTRSWAQSIVTRLFDRWSKGSHVNMVVKAGPTGSTFDLARGNFRCDAVVDVDRIVFPCLRFSGGRIEARRLAINLWSFTSKMIPSSGPRWPNQFDFFAYNVTFTQEDLFQSKCIRNGLKRLLIRVLTKRGIEPSGVTIDSINILPSGKLSVKGVTKTFIGSAESSLAFEVRTHIARTSRGHVVSFPGLEISLNPMLGLFVPIIPEISLDLGNNAQILDVQLDGQKGELRLGAKVTITPDHTLQLLDYIQPSRSFAASFSVDVGRWLTGLGKFA